MLVFQDTNKINRYGESNELASWLNVIQYDRSDVPIGVSGFSYVIVH